MLTMAGQGRASTVPAPSLPKRMSGPLSSVFFQYPHNVHSYGSRMWTPWAMDCRPPHRPDPLNTLTVAVQSHGDVQPALGHHQVRRLMSLRVTVLLPVSRTAHQVPASPPLSATALSWSSRGCRSAIQPAPVIVARIR